MSGYVLSVDVEFDLDDIREYIAADSVEGADRWIEKLFAALKRSGKHLVLGIGVKTSLLTRFILAGRRSEHI